MKIECTLNGQRKTLDVSSTRRLLDILREDFHLTAVKEGCGEGECGACMVLMDGKAVNACLIPAGNLMGKEIVTPEGFKESPRGKIIEEALIEAGAVQCGFCTPGFVMAIESLLNEHPHPTEENIREGLSGNLCRCTGYQMIFKSVRLAEEKGAGLW
ncbi:MAG: (2Fe-2S)-binding protein [Candidatus Marinimicrobia bacterium]|nr:(2Fe-2S)-binding protein [Candidatus Neomarinimicrobiota bacterium]MDD5583242.1 (2Fe-2S)-binding protein [Candidatus Neomarinimicrobiota bacterium]